MKQKIEYFYNLKTLCPEVHHWKKRRWHWKYNLPGMAAQTCSSNMWEVRTSNGLSVRVLPGLHSKFRTSLSQIGLFQSKINQGLDLERSGRAYTWQCPRSWVCSPAWKTKGFRLVYNRRRSSVLQIPTVSTNPKGLEKVKEPTNSECFSGRRFMLYQL